MLLIFPKVVHCIGASPVMGKMSSRENLSAGPDVLNKAKLLMLLYHIKTVFEDIYHIIALDR